MKLECRVNGQKIELEAGPAERLLDILRRRLNLTGTKEGCGEGECGACSVLIDGRLSNSCLIPAAQMTGKDIVTIEGYRESPQGQLLIDCFTKAHSSQCGFCTPGMILAAAALLKSNGDPSEEEIRLGLSGNICRCTGYDMIIDGILAAAARGKEEGLSW